MTSVGQVKEELQKFINPQKAEFLPRFFQAFPGGYGEGDRFIGVAVPDQRKIAGKYYHIFTLSQIESLLQEEIHEYRLTALIMLVHRYEKSEGEKEKKQIVDLYRRNIPYINNWDLVDLTAPKILGAHLMGKKRDLLYELAASGHLWKQRIAVMSTFYFIRQHDFTDTLQLAKMFLNHEHDLMHKAVGWMLREIGKRDLKTELQFLEKYYQEMPRTMLRYAIEKFDPELRKKFLKGQI